MKQETVQKIPVELTGRLQAWVVSNDKKNGELVLKRYQTWNNWLLGMTAVLAVTVSLFMSFWLVVDMVDGKIVVSLPIFVAKYLVYWLAPVQVIWLLVRGLLTAAKHYFLPRYEKNLREDPMCGIVNTLLGAIRMYEGEKFALDNLQGSLEKNEWSRRAATLHRRYHMIVETGAYFYTHVEGGEIDREDLQDLYEYIQALQSLNSEESFDHFEERLADEPAKAEVVEEFTIGR